MRSSSTTRPLRVATVSAAAWLLASALVWTLLDRYPRHGWNASWYAELGEAPILMDRTLEHRVAFPSMHRPYARLLQGWRFERAEVPAELPPIRIRLSAMVRVPEGGARTFSFDSPNQVTLRVDGRDASGRPIRPGLHRLDVRWRAQPDPQRRPEARDNRAVRFALHWTVRGAHPRPVPREALTPASGRWPWTRVALLLSMCALALGGAAVVWVTVRRRRTQVLWVLGVVGLGLFLRVYDYDVMPEFSENTDELFATWNGWSLVVEGKTRGWSMWPARYGASVHTKLTRYFGVDRTVVTPYFEHPPLLHVLVGAAARIGGAEHYLHAKLRHTRLVPVALSALTMLLLMWFGHALLRTSSAPRWAALLYAVTPTIALQNRAIKEEALLAPLLLGGLCFFLRWRDRGERFGDLAVAAGLLGLGTLTKVPAVVWIPALVMLVLAAGRPRAALCAGAMAGGVAALWPLFGTLTAGHAFWLMQTAQATRPTHWNLFIRFFETTLINHNVVGRGWLLFLWAGTFGYLARLRWQSASVVLVPVVSYLCAIGIGSGNWTFGWYMLPIYPFLCLGGGLLLSDLWRRPSLFFGFLFVALIVFYSLNFTLDIHDAMQPPSWPGIRRMVTLSALALLAPYALAQVWPRSPWAVAAARIATVGGLAIFVFVSASYVMRYDETFDAYRDFDRRVYFHR